MAMMRSINELANRVGGEYVTLERSLSLAFLKDIEQNIEQDIEQDIKQDIEKEHMSHWREVFHWPSSRILSRILSKILNRISSRISRRIIYHSGEKSFTGLPQGYRAGY